MLSTLTIIRFYLLCTLLVISSKPTLCFFHSVYVQVFYSISYSVNFLSHTIYYINLSDSCVLISHKIFFALSLYISLSVSLSLSLSLSLWFFFCFWKKFACTKNWIKDRSYLFPLQVLLRGFFSELINLVSLLVGQFNRINCLYYKPLYY